MIMFISVLIMCINVLMIILITISLYVFVSSLLLLLSQSSSLRIILILIITFHIIEDAYNESPPPPGIHDVEARPAAIWQVFFVASRGCCSHVNSF